MEGSASWRIPLGVQMLPGALLAVGSFFLPPSPRLLIFQGKDEAALLSLARLRRRSLGEARTDPLIQVSQGISFIQRASLPSV